jgi:antitoxin (DNA-binding transcriptional repressor) of toxin-antitoxin stability system
VTAVSIHDLLNHGAEIVDRVLAGERVVILRSGEPGAELRPVQRRGPDAATLLARWRSLPPVDPDALRADLDAVTDSTL